MGKCPHQYYGTILLFCNFAKAVLRGKIIAKSAYLKKLRQRNLDALQLDLQKLGQEHKERPNDKT